jgi:hypothetical protein
LDEHRIKRPLTSQGFRKNGRKNKPGVVGEYIEVDKSLIQPGVLATKDLKNKAGKNRSGF